MLLSATWTGAAKRGFQLTDLSRWLSEEPAKLCGLSHTLGAIKPGLQANLTIFDPNIEFVCEQLHHRHPGSPYEGRTWLGLVQATYLRGHKVYSEGEFSVPKGRLIIREKT